MKSQLKLFTEDESPITGLSRRRKLTEFKRRFRIVTRRFSNNKVNPWLALLVPDYMAVEDAMQNQVELFERGYGDFGHGELSAIRALCEINDLPQPDSPLHEQVAWKLRQ